jgi:hypothetical protein
MTMETGEKKCNKAAEVGLGSAQEQLNLAHVRRDALGDGCDSITA